MTNPQVCANCSERLRTRNSKAIGTLDIACPIGIALGCVANKVGYMASCWTVVLGISEFFLRQDVRDARMWDQLDFWPMHEKTGDTSNGAVVLASANDRGMPLPALQISCGVKHMVHQQLACSFRARLRHVRDRGDVRSCERSSGRSLSGLSSARTSFGSPTSQLSSLTLLFLTGLSALMSAR